MNGHKFSFALMLGAAALLGLPSIGHTALLEVDLAPSRRAPELNLSLLATDFLADAEQETLYPRLWPLSFYNVQSMQSAQIRLYDVYGTMDPAAATELDSFLGDMRDIDNPRVTTMDRRMLQLVFKAAYHFGSHQVTVVSAYRDPTRSREGRHGEGKAIDFRLNNVSPPTLAAYLRTQAHVGVGVYTNAATQFVHLDNRPDSFHWIDASPPGRRWHERSLGRGGIAQRDAAYQCENDWPEGTLPRAARACALASSADAQEANHGASEPTDWTVAPGPVWPEALLGAGEGMPVLAPTIFLDPSPQ